MQTYMPFYVDLDQPYGPPWPVIKISLLFTFTYSQIFITAKSILNKFAVENEAYIL
jgi:hypothetical protein